MNLTFSYHLPYNNHYPGELYKRFFSFIKEKYKINIKFVDSREISKKYNIKHDYQNGLPSITNIYNLLIINEDNNKTFVNSLHDYAPATLDDGSGIEKFEVVKYCTVSRLTNDFIENSPKKNIIQPSIYMLETINEHDYIEKNKNNIKLYDKVYFNGLTYGERGKIIKLLNESNRFDFFDKSDGGYLPKDKYYEKLSSYKFGFNMDGVAKICYRDLECFGLRTLLLREELDVNLYNNIEKDKHYICIMDDEVKQRIYKNETKEVIELIEHKINEVLVSGKYEYVINEAETWFKENCLPNKQIEILDKFLENLDIFK